MSKKTLLSVSMCIVLLGALVIFSCNKSQQDRQTTTNDGKLAAAVVEDKSIQGLISKDHAQRMSAAFAIEYPAVTTKYVGFSTRNLAAFLNKLIENNQDTVFVALGRYDDVTAPKPSYIGISTVYFAGGRSKNANSSGLKKVNEDNDNPGNYLNTGAPCPPEIVCVTIP